MLRTGMLFVNGWQTIPLADLDPRRVLATALAGLQARRDDVEGPEHPRLIIGARPQGTMVELEFVATTRQENVADQPAYPTDEAPIPSVDDLSLGLPRRHAAAVRHRKFHGGDSVTVHVEGSG